MFPTIRCTLWVWLGDLNHAAIRVVKISILSSVFDKKRSPGTIRRLDKFDFFAPKSRQKSFVLECSSFCISIEDSKNIVLHKIFNYFLSTPHLRKHTVLLTSSFLVLFLDYKNGEISVQYTSALKLSKSLYQQFNGRLYFNCWHPFCPRNKAIMTNWVGNVIVNKFNSKCYI